MAEQRQFPQSLEAERAVLGGLLLDHAQVPSISEILTPEDFYSSAHAKLFQLMGERSNKNEPLDVLGLADHIMSTNQAEAFGGLSYATSLPEQVPTTENLDYYAGIVREKAALRRLLDVASSISRAVHDGTTPLPELLDLAERRVFEVSQQRAAQAWHGLGAVVNTELHRIENLATRGASVTGLATHFVDVDKILAGLQRSDLLIIAARPAMGKTALALNIAQNIAVKSGVGVGVFSLEMSRGQLATRMLCAQARVDAGRVRTGMLSRDEDWPRLEEASELLYHAPLWIDDSPGITVSQVRARARRLVAEHGNLGLIVVDYLQLMSGGGDAKVPREQQISAISRGLKGLAKELDIPILALSQLNRGVEGRSDKRPMVSDLRESGAIEQDADIIMFIYRDDYYNPDSTEPGVAEVIVAKQRNGPTGTVKLAFQGRYTRFDNLAPDLGSGGYL